MGGSEKHQKKVKGGWSGAVWPGKGVHGPVPSSLVLSCLVELYPYIWISLGFATF